MSYKVSVIIEKDNDGYYSYCPDLPGCQTQGDNLNEVVSNIKEAIELYIVTENIDFSIVSSSAETEQDSSHSEQ
ncbi:MAG: type II toxin-antitoxin system HicB family antitoxin [Symploca sp. SIO1B1]|nr:type II toxin-antitoxin system HicB family antitoxin [Symploca sp. SIO2D2]NES01211.1 type II toxin-antitoxin system HicB family antitoxin [Symploca sp. SIO1B1]